jgi:hypothetical protein
VCSEKLGNPVADPNAFLHPGWIIACVIIIVFEGE